MTKKEIVFVPTPAMGHLFSTVEFAKLLLQRDQRISVLIIVLQIPAISSTSAEAYVKKQSHKLDPNRITFLTLPPLSDPPHPASMDFFRSVVELYKPVIDQAITDRLAIAKPVAFVLDMLCAHFIDIANQINVPTYVYFTSGANLLNFMLYFQSLVDNKREDTLSLLISNSDVMLQMPGFKNLLPTKLLPSAFLDKENGWYNFTIDLARKIKEAKGVLINTFMDLEPYAIQALVGQIATKNPIVYPVGPILAFDEGSHDGSEEEDHHHRESSSIIMQWLDEQPPSSVVFLCFGSMGCFNAEQVMEIAKGLEGSGCRFLWSLRRPPGEGKLGDINERETFEDALPDGFMDRTEHRGKVIGWAPQVSVLAHQAVGGFVSHCGWNSTLESLWFGVPIATWPLYAEQQMNAFELVKDLGLAVEVKMDYARDLKNNKVNCTVTADEVETGLNKLMNMNDEMKANVTEIKGKSRQALEIGGLSYNSLTRFVENIFDE